MEEGTNFQSYTQHSLVGLHNMLMIYQKDPHRQVLKLLDKNKELGVKALIKHNDIIKYI